MHINHAPPLHNMDTTTAPSHPRINHETHITRTHCQSHTQRTIPNTPDAPPPRHTSSPPHANITTKTTAPDKHPYHSSPLRWTKRPRSTHPTPLDNPSPPPPGVSPDQKLHHQLHPPPPNHMHTVSKDNHTTSKTQTPTKHTRTRRSSPPTSRGLNVGELLPKREATHFIPRCMDPGQSEPLTGFSRKPALANK